MAALTVKSANGKQESENQTNEKDLKKAMPVTGQLMGSNRRALDCLNIGVYAVDDEATIEAGSDDNIVVISAHPAKVGDIIRFISTANNINEFEVHVDEIIDANRFKLSSILSADLEAGDTVSILRAVTQRFTEDGASLTTVESAPVSFMLDGTATQVVEDTAEPGNNTPLPVKLTSVTGDINITAGDLNVQLSDVGVNADKTRIGDGSGNYLGINASAEALVNDADANDKLADILTELQSHATLAETQPVSAASLPLPTGAATDAKLDDIVSAIGSIAAGGDATAENQVTGNGYLETISEVDFATEATLADILTELESHATLAETQPVSLASVPLATDAATESKQDAGNLSLDNIDTNIGDVADAAVANPASSGSMVAILKGLLTLIISTNTKLDSLETNTSPNLDSTTNVTASANTLSSMPANARFMVIQNSTEAAGALRWTESGTTPSASTGFLLQPGQSTSLLPAGSIRTISIDGSSAIDACVAWFV